ncbi:MAG: hypothetical protein IPM61_03885 [Chlorobi bacterium]|nr:hypothetical protein [Chlorobiota bacterium]MBX7216979.1 hypothetical protein [Candidatus Kapabacteria bacterium]
MDRFLLCGLEEFDELQTAANIVFMRTPLQAFFAVVGKNAAVLEREAAAGGGYSSSVAKPGLKSE